MSEVSQSSLFVVDMHRGDRYMFGADIAEMAKHTIEIGRCDLDHNTNIAVGALKMRVRAMVESKNPSDTYVVSAINDKFSMNDMTNFRIDKGDRMDNPPEQTDNILSWLPTASHRDVALLAIWHNVRRHDLQDSLNRDRGYFEENTLKNVAYLIRTGTIPEHARELYEKSFEQYKGYVALGSFESGATGYEGYFDDNVKGIANHYSFTNLTGKNPNQLGTIFHEDTHGAARKRGFFWGITTHRRDNYLRLAEEFMTSHLTAVATADRRILSNKSAPTIIHPDRRKDSGYQSYKMERKFFGTIAEKGHIPVRLFGDAFFSSRYVNAGINIRKYLESRIENVFDSPGEFLEIADAYEAAEEDSKRITILKNAIDRLLGHTDDLIETIPSSEAPLSITSVSVED